MIDNKQKKMWRQIAKRELARIDTSNPKNNRGAYGKYGYYATTVSSEARPPIAQGNGKRRAKVTLAKMPWDDAEGDAEMTGHGRE